MHIYTVTIATTPATTIHVRAESKAQARAAVANSMINVERADSDALLDIKREDVINATVEQDAGLTARFPGLNLSHLNIGQASQLKLMHEKDPAAALQHAKKYAQPTATLTSSEHGVAL